MNRKGRSVENLDDLLKAALADDLPAEVAEGMRDRLAGFRSKMIKEEETLAGRTFWFYRRGLWATMAILMLIAGCLLQGFRLRTPLADRIALMKIKISNAEPTRPPDGGPAIREATPVKRAALIPGEKEARL